MIGAICGDILGSTYEFGVEGDIHLIHPKDTFTDDTILTCAVAEWCLKYSDIKLGVNEHNYLLAKLFYNYTKRYSDKAYGNMYSTWFYQFEKTGKVPSAYNSYGNGSAMRVSPIAYAFRTLEEVEHYAKLQSCVTHNNAEGIRGAMAIASSTKLALDGASKVDIQNYVEKKYFYDLSKSVQEMKLNNIEFSATCQVTVPQSIRAFLESENYTSAIMNAINIGGDCDTVAAMTGSIAYAFYKEIPEEIKNYCSQTALHIKKNCIGLFTIFYIVPQYHLPPDKSFHVNCPATVLLHIPKTALPKRTLLFHYTLGELTPYFPSLPTQ